MSNISCIEKLEKLEQIVAKYQDRLDDKAKIFLNENNLKNSQELNKSIQEISDNERLLKIGIVGRVKAGKSSLINALLFDGKNILPAAATPMTAALTQISYAPNFSVKVDFFSQKDIDDIKNDAKKYEEKLQNLIQEKLEDLKTKKNNQQKSEEELKEMAEKSAKRELSETSIFASFDRYQRIKQSNIDISTLSEENLSYASLEELQNALNDYVGSNGKFMPFTRSVNIFLPFEKLEGVSVVDTPGLNDPVVSREQRTKDELDKCDVIFIVSPAGQFMDINDTNLMDRISSKNGIRELFVVASKYDAQLHSSVKDEANGNLNLALENLKKELANHLKTNLINLKKNAPEIGSTFDKLIEKSDESVFLSSGACLSVLNHLDDLSQIKDDDLKYAYEILKENYPDNFCDEATIKASLKKLANIEIIKTNLDEVSKRKEEIKNQKIQDFIASKISIIDEFAEHLISYAKSRSDEIKNSNIESLKQEQNELLKVKEVASEAVDDEYDDAIKGFELDLHNLLISKLNGFFKEAREDASEAEGEVTKTEEYEVSTSKWYNPFSWGNSETRTRSYQVTTIRTGAVKHTLQDLVNDIENEISATSSSQILAFKKSLASKLIKALRSEVSDDHINSAQLRKIVRSVINSFEFPEISYANKALPHGSGVLEGKEADEFLDKTNDFILYLKSGVNTDIKNFIAHLVSKLKSIHISKELFNEYDKRIEDLKNDIENQTLSLEELDKIQKEIQEI